MRTITKILLLLNGGVLIFILLWLLVGGGQRGYFGGGAAVEVDGILLMGLGLFNVCFLVTVFFGTPVAALPTGGAPPAEALAQEVFQGEQRFRRFLRTWSLWGLCVNGAVILFIGLWLLLSSDRRGYFQANATEVDVILLLLISILNVGYMGITFLRFSR